MDHKKAADKMKDKLFIVREIGTFEDLPMKDPTITEVTDESNDELMKRIHEENLKNLPKEDK